MHISVSIHPPYIPQISTMVSGLFTYLEPELLLFWLERAFFWRVSHPKIEDATGFRYTYAMTQIRQNAILGGGFFNIFWIFTLILGVLWSNLTWAYFSNGLVQPPTSYSMEPIRSRPCTPSLKCTFSRNTRSEAVARPMVYGEDGFLAFGCLDGWSGDVPYVALLLWSSDMYAAPEN